MLRFDDAHVTMHRTELCCGVNANTTLATLSFLPILHTLPWQPTNTVGPPSSPHFAPCRLGADHRSFAMFICKVDNCLFSLVVAPIFVASTS